MMTTSRGFGWVVGGGRGYLGWNGVFCKLSSRGLRAQFSQKKFD